MLNLSCIRRFVFIPEVQIDWLEIDELTGGQLVTAYKAVKNSPRRRPCYS